MRSINFKRNDYIDIFVYTQNQDIESNRSNND